MTKCWEHKNDYIEKNKGEKGGWNRQRGEMDAGEKENGKETIFLKEGYVTICYPGHGHLSKLGDVFPETRWKHTLLYI